ncbi:hypothetical protein L6164_001587 [Bauhinia variegata]|uniref:Uncharacterized protein n=1 Tax=Bauhinia variegata TaxID=167791 RepID=A0ACB9Q9Z3_BAUVA|nr:hypothetical protein L6164_001587 [Bauhinia variegata]
MAFILFAEENINIAAIELVWVAAIGGSLETIAMAKSGIIKASCFNEKHALLEKLPNVVQNWQIILRALSMTRNFSIYLIATNI